MSARKWLESSALNFSLWFMNLLQGQDLSCFTTTISFRGRFGEWTVPRYTTVWIHSERTRGDTFLSSEDCCMHWIASSILRWNKQSAWYCWVPEPQTAMSDPKSKDQTWHGPDMNPFEVLDPSWACAVCSWTLACNVAANLALGHHGAMPILLIPLGHAHASMLSLIFYRDLSLDGILAYSDHIEHVQHNKRSLCLYAIVCLYVALSCASA